MGARTVEAVELGWPEGLLRELGAAVMARESPCSCFTAEEVLAASQEVPTIHAWFPTPIWGYSKLGWGSLLPQLPEQIVHSQCF